MKQVILTIVALAAIGFAMPAPTPTVGMEKREPAGESFVPLLLKSKLTALLRLLRGAAKPPVPDAGPPIPDAPVPFSVLYSNADGWYGKERPCR